MKLVKDQDRQERRKHKRLPFKEDILVDGSELCSSRDISEGGLFIAGIQYFNRGNVIEIVVPLGDETITLKAQVQYCQPGIGAGVLFVHLTDRQKEKIRELVEKIAKAD